MSVRRWYEGETTNLVTVRRVASAQAMSSHIRSLHSNVAALDRSRTSLAVTAPSGRVVGVSVHRGPYHEVNEADRRLGSNRYQVTSDCSVEDKLFVNDLLFEAVSHYASETGIVGTTNYTFDRSWVAREFDVDEPRLLVRSGDCFPELEEFMVEALGGDFIWNPDGWRHTVDIDGESVVFDYRWNETYWGESFDASHLLPDASDVVFLLVARDGDGNVAERHLPLVEGLLGELRVRRSSLRGVPTREATRGKNHGLDRAKVLEELRRFFPSPQRRFLSEWASPETHRGALPGEIAEAEGALGVTLPALLKEMLLERNGGGLRGTHRALTHSDFAGVGEDAGWRRIDRPRPWFYDGLSSPEGWKPSRPLSGLIPLTGDGHNDLCLDYRRSGPHLEPQISFIDNEMETDELVADSIADFLSQLGSNVLSLAVAFEGSREELANLIHLNMGIAPSTSGGWLDTDGRGEAWILPNIPPVKDPTAPLQLYLPEFPEASYVVEASSPEFVLRVCEILAEAEFLIPALPLNNWFSEDGY